MHHLGSASFYELLIVKDASSIFAKLDLTTTPPQATTTTQGCSKAKIGSELLKNKYYWFEEPPLSAAPLLSIAPRLKEDIQR